MKNCHPISFFIFESSIQHNIVKGISRIRGMIDINNLRQFTCHVIRQQRFGICRRGNKRKSSKSRRRSKSTGQRRTVRSRAQGWRDSFSRQRAYVRDWQERRTKVKTRRRATETKFLKAVTGSYLLFFFFMICIKNYYRMNAEARKEF